jgi:hypothetical protein
MPWSGLRRKRSYLRKEIMREIDPQNSSRRGALPTRNVLGCILALLLPSAALLTSGCGGTSMPTTTSTLARGTTQIKIGDAPADSVLALELTITNIALKSQSGNTVTVLSSPTEVEVSHLAGTVETLTLNNVPNAIYTQATVSYSGAEVTYIPTGSTTPAEKRLSTSGTATIALNNLTIGDSSVISFDLNAAQSLVFDASGNVTSINPFFTVSVVNVAAENMQEEESGAFEGVGLVSTGPANNSFVLSLEVPGQSVNILVNSNTSYQDGLTKYGDLKQGMLVEVEAFTQPDGSLMAQQIELVENQGVEAEGIITSLNSPLTQFTIVDNDGIGTGFQPSDIGSTINVNVSAASTLFSANLQNLDMSGLNFSFKGPTNVAKGQNVQVESTAGMQSNNTINSDHVVLVKQALGGTVSNYTSNGSSATFTLNLPSDSAFFKLTGVNAITVYRQPGTQLKDLTSVGNGATVRVRGLLFYDGANYQFVASRITQP